MKIKLFLLLLFGAAIARAQTASTAPLAMASCGWNAQHELVIDNVVVTDLYLKGQLTAGGVSTEGTPQVDGAAAFSGGFIVSTGIVSPKPIQVTLAMAKGQTTVEAGGTVFQSFSVPAGITIQKVGAMWQIGAYPDPVNREWDLQIYMTSATAGVVYAKNNSFQKYPFPSTVVLVSVN